MILLIDNYDSFTFNLAQYLGVHKMPMKIIKNDYTKFNQINFDKISHIVISPGPGSPDNSKLSLNSIQVSLKRSIPLLGVCLGHQAIAKIFGLNVRCANSVMHGKVSVIKHNSLSRLFKNVPITFNAVRYHSLIVDNFDNDDIIVSSISDQNEIMSIEHKKKPIYGVQFHPESILTDHGKLIIKNFLNIV